MTGDVHGNDYESVPYPEMSHVETHPAHLAMIGKLLGLDPAPVENCRVLDIGCAGGWNLIPMAGQLPESTFVGIDYAKHHIDSAQAAVTSLNLDNITFLQMDIRDFPDDMGDFDYIIAHGVYSWVPQVIRDRILAICRLHLKPQGIAYISFNTLPGWHMMLMMREMMQYRVKDIDDPYEKAKTALEFIEFLANESIARQNHAYKQVLETYLSMRPGDINDRTNLTVLLHDELGEINEPFHFHEFVEQITRHGLQYLADCDFSKLFPMEFNEDTVNHLNNIASTHIEMEQYLDFLRQRGFRRALICHDDISIQRTLVPDSIAGLYVGSLVNEIESNEAGIRFRSKSGFEFSSDHPVTVESLRYLTEIAPERHPLKDIFRTVCIRLKITPDPYDARQLAINLLQTLIFGADIISISAIAPTVKRTVSQKPIAQASARMQARQSIPVTNLHHDQITLNPIALTILACLDGEHDLPAIQAILNRRFENRQIDSAEITSVLGYLAKNAFLVG